MSNDNQLDLDVVISSSRVAQAILDELIRRNRRINSCSLPSRIGLVYYDEFGIDETMVIRQARLDSHGIKAKAIYVETYCRLENTSTYRLCESYHDEELLSDDESDSPG